jgi:hypothetical protein
MGLKVTITPQNDDGEIIGSPVTLCDGPDPLPTFGVTVNGRPVLQIVQFLQAEYIRVFDRQGRQTTIGFTVKRGGIDRVPFAGPAAALAFAIDQCGSPAACPHFGLIKLELKDESTSLIRAFDRAGLQELGLARLNGVALQMNYRIIGGEPLKALPNS